MSNDSRVNDSRPVRGERAREFLALAADDPYALVARVEAATRSYDDIQYAVPAGYRPLLLDLHVPEGIESPPLVVSIHGGAWLHGSHKSRPGDVVPYAELWKQLLDRGVAVASLQYRHAREAPFPAQMDDLREALSWLRRSSEALQVDASRLGVFGESAGGHLGLMLSANTNDSTLSLDDAPAESIPIVVAAVWYPLTRLDTVAADRTASGVITYRPEESPVSTLIGENFHDNRDRARWASPISYVGARSAPTLLIHGTADRLVPHRQSEAYHEVLLSAGVDSELLLVPGADHCFFGVDTDPIVVRTADYLAARLGRIRPTTS